MEKVYEGDAGTDSNSLEVIVARLRRKIGHDLIETVRGRGYRLASGGTADVSPCLAQPAAAAGGDGVHRGGDRGRCDRRRLRAASLCAGPDRPAARHPGHVSVVAAARRR